MKKLKLFLPIVAVAFSGCAITPPPPPACPDNSVGLQPINPERLTPPQIEAVKQELSKQQALNELNNGWEPYEE